MAITKFLLNHAKEDNVSFHMPGHKGSRIYRENGYDDFLNMMVDMDVTEIPGADNLFQTEGIIKATMGRYAESYDAQKSYLLINGSSAGIIASMMATCEEGDSIIMARNCHKSAFNGLVLGRIKPVYAYPQKVDGYGISGEIKVEEIERCLKEKPNAKAVILPSPNYYGICSDIEKIANLVHGHGKILIVDQAHGAHLKMFSKMCASSGLPKSAEEQGADLVINSTHKTLASFTQSAILNVMTDRVDFGQIEDKLQQLESTSPSYMLMAGLDVNADLMEKHGQRLLEEWLNNLEFFYDEAQKIKGLKVLRPENLDFTKINIDMGIDGLRLEELLMKRGIYSELVTGNILMCMTGIGNTRRDFERLLSALSEIAEELEDNLAHREGLAVHGLHDSEIFAKRLDMAEIPKAKEMVAIEEAEGRVCASSIIPYPPGIPIVCPGEILEGDVLRYVKELRMQGEKVMGVDDEMRVCVGTEIKL